MSDVTRIVEQLTHPSHLHLRVDPVFLPLSVRQNRIEDVFSRFLEWLSPPAGSEIIGARRTPRDVSDLVLGAARAKTNSFRFPPEGTSKTRLISEWLQSELLVEGSATNRKEGEDVSVVPLHVEIARHFEVPGQPPNYGRFVCEFLARGGEGLDWDTVDKLATFFASDGDDPLARLVGRALGDDDAREPIYRARSNSFDQQWVYATEHARQFRIKVQSALEYSTVTSRRTMLEWLYALIAFFVATYFLRLAAAAESYALAIEGVFEGCAFGWGYQLDDARFSPRLLYGHRVEEHSRLMRQLPSWTSQIGIARHFVKLADSEIDHDPGDLLGFGAALEATLHRVDAEEVFAQAADAYPISSGSGKSSFKLTAGEKARYIQLAERSDMSHYSVFSRSLNWEDMGRRSNNVMEWQFYSSLARNRSYGFAVGLQKGDALVVKMSSALLTALAHCHCREFEGQPTLASFVQSLENLGFAFEGDARLKLEHELVELGMLEALADASDAKRLRPLFLLEGAGT